MATSYAEICAFCAVQFTWVTEKSIRWSHCRCHTQDFSRNSLRATWAILHRKDVRSSNALKYHSLCCCCNLSVDVALNLWFTTNGMCAKNKIHIYMWHEQAKIEWLRRMIFIVACCHSVKLCALAARDFRSQHCKVSLNFIVQCSLHYQTAL